MITTRSTFLLTFVGIFERPRSVSLAAVLVSSSACGPAELTGQGGTDESTGDTGDTGTGTGEALEPACQFEWEWRQRVDGFTQPLPDVRAIDVDEAGNVYAIGELGELGDLDETDPPVYETDIWVASWGPDGTQTWVRTFGEPGQIDSGWTLQVGPDGGLFVLGTVSGGGTWWPLWLARLDPETGDELWSQVDMAAFAVDLAQTADDQLIVLGTQDQYPNYLPWLSERSPVDGSVTWARNDAVAVSPDKHLVGLQAVAVSNTGDLRVAGTWNYTEWQGDFSPQGGDLLLTYDPLGELLEVEVTSEGWDYRQSVLIDGSANVYFLSKVDVESGPAPMQLESRAADGSLEWLVAESEWSVGGGRRELTRIGIDLGEGVLDIAGSARDFPDGGSLWTAKIDPDNGALTRGCVHMVDDPDTGEPMRQVIHASASGPAGGLAIYGHQSSPDRIGSYWVWMRYLGG